MTMIYFLLIPIFFVIFRLLVSFYASLTSPLKSVPGPLIARFTRLWYLARVSNGHFERDNILLHRKYGPIVRIAPNLYSIDSPEVVQKVYGVGSKFAKSDWYDGFRHPNQDLWTLFPDRNIKRHHDTKKAFQSLYNMTSVVGYEKYVEDCSEILIERLNDFANDNDNYIDIGHWFQCYAFDVMSNMTYSERFGFLDAGEDINGIMGALRKHMRYASQVGIYPKIHPLIYGFMSRFKSSGAHSRNILIQLVGRKIAQRRKEREMITTGEKDLEKTREDSNIPEDFLNKMIIANEQDPEKVTPYMVFMMALANIIAGADTTATSLSGILYHLLRNPKTLDKLRDEIQQKCSTPRVKFKDTQDMPYLQAVIKEALRMHSAVGLPLWREVPEGGVQICGQFFPSGSVVGLNSWTAHYNPDIFDEPECFKPERWIKSGKEDNSEFKVMETYFCPFGLGARACLGRHISMLEMSLLIPEIIRRFDFEMEDPINEWRTSNSWFVIPEGFKVRIKTRDGK